ncbi:RICIN domain-containing protein [Nonomuraea sp. NPDC050404]|uniref:RICIN domain-containing protein n=1 Tax=Nonomuraea sp. NPDC050404 TaxID=3155783 RepID=UPI0033D35B4C
MRRHVRELVLEIGAFGGLTAVCTVAAGILLNLSTEGEPTLNPSFIPPTVLLSFVAGAVPALRDYLRGRRVRLRASGVDPFGAKDLESYKGLLREAREKARSPNFGELDRRAAAREVNVGREELRLITQKEKGTLWLREVEQAEPIVRAFLVLHDVSKAEVGEWLEAYRELVDPPSSVPVRVLKLIAVAAVPALFATLAFVGYVQHAEAQVRDSLRRTNVTILSQHAIGRYLAVTGSESAPARARVGPSVISKSPSYYRWDFEPHKLDGTYFHQIRDRANRLCLTPEARNVVQGGFITEAACEGSDAQLWRLGRDGALATARGGMCVEPNMGSTEAGTSLVLRSCAAGKLAQLWSVTDRLPSIGGSVASAVNGVCLDAAAGMSELVSWGCHGRANQAFTYRGDPRGGYEVKVMDTCLGVLGSRPVRESCSGGRDQLWRFTHRTSFNHWLYWGEVRHVASGLCLQLESDFASLSMRACDWSNVQQWRTPEWLRPPDAPALPVEPSGGRGSSSGQGDDVRARG